MAKPKRSDEDSWRELTRLLDECREIGEKALAGAFQDLYLHYNPKTGWRALLSLSVIAPKAWIADREAGDTLKCTGNIGEQLV